VKARLAALVVAMALGVTAPANAAFQPLEPSVEGGEQSWHAESFFTVRWSNPPGVATVHYRLLGPPSGQPVSEEIALGWPATAIEALPVPPIPGVYTLEIWLENELGGKGVPVPVQLRFDSTAPGKVEPQSLGEWLGRTSFPLMVSLGHPAGPQPLAGIRGYAVSIDATPGAMPCAGLLLCTEAETDLRAGIAGNALTIATLPDGINHLSAVAVSNSGMRSEEPGRVLLRVDKADPLTRLYGVPDGWSRKPLTLTATATDRASGMQASGTGPAPYTAIRVDGGAPAIASGDTVYSTVIASGVHHIAYYARDAAGNVADPGVDDGWGGNPPGTALVKIDREPPVLAFSGAQDPHDPERIVTLATDELSGLDPARGVIEVRRLGSGERFAQLATRISDGVLSARWASDAQSPGKYEFRATAYDLAGNSATTSVRSSGAPMRLSSPLKVPTRLVVAVERPTVPFGDATSFEGRLLAGRRAPLAGAPVQVVERFEAGASGGQRLTTVRTGADGGFRLRLAPGPSRQIVAATAPTATQSGATSRELRISVHSGVHLRASAPVARIGGRPLIFSGRVRGEAMPAEGKTVELQFRLPNGTWSEFRTVRTNSRGRFRYPYRFADDDSRGIRFQFRAFVPAQAGWPFEPAGSLPVRVRGV